MNTFRRFEKVGGLFLTRPYLRRFRLTAWATPRAFDAVSVIDARGVAHAVKRLISGRARDITEPCGPGSLNRFRRCSRSSGGR